MRCLLLCLSKIEIEACSAETKIIEIEAFSKLLFAETKIIEIEACSDETKIIEIEASDALYRHRITLARLAPAFSQKRGGLALRTNNARFLFSLLTRPRRR